VVRCVHTMHCVCHGSRGGASHWATTHTLQIMVVVVVVMVTSLTLLPLHAPAEASGSAH
jgi:hypothetical protein